MKKLITLISAASISATPAMAVVSCKYVDTVQKSIDNKLAEVMSSTSNYFKGAILANSKGYNGQDVDKYISNLSVRDITQNSKDTTSFSKLFSSLLDTSQTNEYMNKNVYTKDDFNNPKPENPLAEKLSVIQKAYNEIYKLIGVSFDPMVWNDLLPILLKSVNDDTSFSIQEIMSKITSSLSIMKEVKVPNYKELIKMGIKTNRDLQMYFSSQLTTFIANLFGKDIPEDLYFDFSVEHEDIRKDFYNWNKEQMSKIFINDKTSEKITVSFTSQSLALLFNALFGINWYIQNFTTDEYNLKSTDMIDDNHVFSKTKTNLEIISEINNKKIEESIIDATNIDGLVQLFYDLFSGEKDKDSYKLLRTFKILFQVDNDIITGNEKLEFKTKILKTTKTTLDIELGEWATNGQTENGALNTFLSSTINGIITGFITNKIDKDGGILKFLNRIGLGPEQLGGVASGIISSMLSGIDMTHFFKTFISQLTVSLNHIKEWNSILINEDIKNKIEWLIKKMSEIQEKYKWIIKDNGIFTNKFLGYLANTDIRTIMHVLGLTNELPIELPKISLKQLINVQLTSNIKLGDILTLGTNAASYLIALLGKGVAPKLVNIAEAFQDTRLFQNNDFEIKNAIGTTISYHDEELGLDERLILKDANGVEYTYTFVLASKLFTNEGWTVTIPAGKESGLSEKRTFSNLQAGKWLMGLGVETKTGIDWLQFRPGTILYSVSQLWNYETGNLIKDVMKSINEILILINNMFDDKNKASYLPDLNYLYFSTKLVSYTNFKNKKDESTIKYEINYKNGGINNTYIVELLLPKITATNNDVKYQIQNFEIKK
ncbi:hypothetical protein CS528_00800 [Mesoplasma entomophilum]|uniref:MOLPALP family lipoprotein n=1 Tax=Mesoplasma entomophilum TaxID=2149 RepID=A0A3S5Y0G5_9MOLU|nr:hypothetical protein CS528_00800 [Mesoplasma entomophilum]